MFLQTKITKFILKYRNINTISKLEWNSNYLLASENKQLDTCKFLYNIKPATNEIIKPLYYKNTINNNLLLCKWLLKNYPINLSELRFKSDIYNKLSICPKTYQSNMEILNNKRSIGQYSGYTSNEYIDKIRYINNPSIPLPVNPDFFIKGSY